MDRVAFRISIDLVEDVRELQIEFIFRHISDVRRRQYVRMGQQGVPNVGQGFLIEYIDRRMDTSPGDFGFQSTWLDQSRT